MRRSLVGIVPHEILFRRTKQFGARTPALALEKNLEELQGAFNSPMSSSLGYVNRDRFLENFHAAKNGKETHIIHLLKTISLELWLRHLASRNLTEAATASPMAVAAAP
jgi:hypothetical protein